MDHYGRARRQFFTKQRVGLLVILILVVTVIVLATREHPKCPIAAENEKCPGCPACRPSQPSLDYNVMADPIELLFSPSRSYNMGFYEGLLGVLARFGHGVNMTWSVPAPDAVKFGVNRKGQLYYVKKDNTIHTVTPEHPDGYYIGSVTDDGRFVIRTMLNYEYTVVFTSPFETRKM